MDELKTELTEKGKAHYILMHDIFALLPDSLKERITKQMSNILAESNIYKLWYFSGYIRKALSELEEEIGM